ncbi:MAG: helix-turn-helix transcriptional regulator, partial [Clostridia bacterium]|nr:helix-turn-helix transcriptional regulator [Clostridia bacterium]
MNIGTKIRLLRKEKRVTQEELAEYLHISSQAVSKWETGVSNPDIDFLPKLAIFFGTSLDNLLDFDQSQVDAAVEAMIAESGRGGKDPAASEAFLRKALEKYPNNDLLLTCILEDMQEQNADKSRSAEIIEVGERILSCSSDDELKIDVLRILAETYHGMGEQAMA